VTDGREGMDDGPTAAEQAAREAARLRWELSRLRSRRSVRAAMLATEASDARHGGPRDVWATLKGRHVVEDLDVIAPAVTRRRPAYPHLDIAHVGASPPFASAAPHRRVTPDDPDALRRQPPDLIVLDDLAEVAGWPASARHGLRDALGAAGAVVAVVTGAADAEEVTHWPADLALVGPGAPTPRGVRCLPLLPGADVTRDNPVGWHRTPRVPLVVAGTVAGVAAPRIADAMDATEMGAGAALVAQPGDAAGTRAVLALLARGIPVLVPEGARVAEPLTGLVDQVAPADAAEAATAMGADLAARERRSVRQRRTVLREHDQRTRLDAVLSELGVPLRSPERISVLLATRRPSQLEAAVAQIAAQDHPDVEVVAALHGDGFAEDAETRVAELAGGAARTLRVPATAPLGDVLNAALDRATGTLIAKMDDDDLYGAGHLADLVVALDYSGAEIVGRWANEVHLVEPDVTVVQDLDRQERWAHHLPGATMLAHGDAVRAVRFRRVPRHVDTHLLRSIHADGGAAYATHRFGFLRRRHSDHTYDPGDARFDAPGGARVGLDRSVLDV
jgi:hypothetical protein